MICFSKKSKGATLLSITLLVIQLAACGGGSGGTTTSPASPNIAPTNLSAQVAVATNNSSSSNSIGSTSSSSGTSSSTSSNGSSSGTGSSGSTSAAGSGTVVAPPTPSGPYVTANVNVLRTSTGETLNSNFLGLSYEKAEMSGGLFSSTDTTLVNLMKNLGPGIIRIGGNSVNQTTWNANGSGSTAHVIAPADVDRVASLLAATGWKIIYGLNHVTNTPANIASEAQYAAQKFGSSLLGFEIGNEPDIYVTLGYRPKTYTFNDFLVEWQTYHDAIVAVVPNAKITGLAASWNYDGYTVPFAKNKGSEINLLTQHYYVASGQSATSTMSLLLAPDPTLPVDLQKLKAAAKAASVPLGYRLDEANSFYGGGSTTVSPAYGTALWLLDFLFINAENGSSGVNLHGGWTVAYSPIYDNGTIATSARPEYYGMLMFSMISNGAVLSTQTTVSAINFTSHAIAQNDGSTMVLLNNKDATNSAYTTLNLGKNASTAVLTTLTGTDLNSTTGYTLNGTVVDNNGAWSGGTPNTVSVGPNGTVTITVPPMSAILVHAS